MNGHIVYKAHVPDNPQIDGQIFENEAKHIQRYFEVRGTIASRHEAFVEGDYWLAFPRFVMYTRGLEIGR